jgi:tetratricopeptide (TPR) repeat protein
MIFSPKDLKTITRVATNSFFVCLIAVGIIWAFRYYQFKQKNQNVRIDKSGHLMVNNDRVLPIDIEAHRLIAERLLATDQAEKALAHLQRILDFKPNNRTVRFQFARACLDAGYFDKALSELKLLDRSGVKDSCTPKIAALMGIALFYLNDVFESKRQLDSCLTRYPATAEAACFLGQIEAASPPDEASKALYHLEQAVTIDPSYVEGWYQLARYTMQKGNYLKARQQLLQALEIDPLHVKSHSRLGMVYYYLGNFDLAKKSYLTALALNPKDFNTRYNLGELFYTAAGDTESALREFTTTLKESPNHRDANFKVGLICLRNNMVKEAIRYFQTALLNDPKNIRAMMQLAVSYEKLGDRAQALQTYRDIVAVDPLNSIGIQKIKYLSPM